MTLFRNLPKDLIQGLFIYLVCVSLLGLLLLGVASMRPEDLNVKIHGVSIYQTAQNRTVYVGKGPAIGAAVGVLGGAPGMIVGFGIGALTQSPTKVLVETRECQISNDLDKNTNLVFRVFDENSIYCSGLNEGDLLTIKKSSDGKRFFWYPDVNRPWVGIQGSIQIKRG